VIDDRAASHSSRRILSVVVALPLLAWIALLGCSRPEAYDLAITNVTVIDGTGAPAQPNRHVLIRRGRIARIADGSETVRAHEVIDGSAKYLIPGLIDGHAHPFPVETNLPLFARFGVTSILVPGCTDCSDQNIARAIALADDVSFSSPRVFPTSQHVTMEGRHPVKTYPSPRWVEGETVYYLREPADAERFVREVAEDPIVGIKLTIEDGPAPPFVERMPQALAEELVRQAHAHELPVFVHVSDNEELRIAVEAGADHLLHFVGVDLDWERDLELATRVRDQEMSWVTTLMIDKSFFYPARPEWIELVLALGVFDEEEVARLAASRVPEDSLRFLAEAYGIADPTLPSVIRPQVEDLRRLYDLGVNLVVGTDVGNDFIFPGLSIHEEMELLEMGFAPLEILEMATENAARMLGVLEELGTIEEGKAADLVLLDDNPLDSIRNTRSILAVFRAGRRIDPR